MKKALIIVDDELPDAASAQMLQALSVHGAAEVVTLSSYLKGRGLELNVRTGLLRWSSGEGPGPNDPSVYRVYNRVIEISPTTADAFLKPGWAAVAPNFVWTAYAEALQTEPEVRGAAAGIASPGGNVLPLNLQWHALERAVPGLRTPKFKYAIGAESIDVSRFVRPIRKSLFDIYNWSDPYVEAEGIALQQFVVDRPPGNAVLYYFIGDESEAFSLGSDDAVSAELKAELRSYHRGISTSFKAFMGEVLFFVDGNSITFGAFSHHLGTAANHPSFAETMERGLAEDRAA